MDPEGDFVECIGRQDTPDSAAGIVLEHIRDWKREGKSMDDRPLGWVNNKKTTLNTALPQQALVTGTGGRMTA